MEEFRSVRDVVAGLTALEESYAASRDLRGLFATAYLVITRTMQEWIDRGHFLDNERVGEYVVVFANAYRQALSDYETGERSTVPRAWQQSFDASFDRSASILQTLLLGINAHINHDLPYAVLQAGLVVTCDRCYRDHVRIDDALRVATPLVRRRSATIYRRRLHITNWLCGWAIDQAVATSFERARQYSWVLATALASANCAAERARVESLIDDRAALAGEMILACRTQPAECIASLYKAHDLVPYAVRLSERPEPGLASPMRSAREIARGGFIAAG